MKSLLVPTDFSENADNAITFACEMNLKLGATIHLLHSYYVPVPATDIPLVPISDNDMRDIAIEGLTKTKDRFMNRYSGMEFNLYATVGEVDNEVVAYSNKFDDTIIVMGTHGASGMGEVLFGTNTASVMEKAQCPVIAIPEKAAFNGLRKIVFAADYGTHNYDHAIKLIDIARKFNSEVILLHVSSGEIEGAVEDIEISRFKDRLLEATKYPNLSYRLVEDEDVYRGISDYAEKYNPDLITISMRNRSLMERLFSRSLTKRLAYHSVVPVLALHIARN